MSLKAWFCLLGTLEQWYLVVSGYSSHVEVLSLDQAETSTCR
jgi:hypothetical protein